MNNDTTVVLYDGKMTRVYQLENGDVVVSYSDVWVPGIYASEEAALQAVSMTDEWIETHLSSIYRADGEGRRVTVEDILEALEGE